MKARVHTLDQQPVEAPDAFVEGLLESQDRDTGAVTFPCLDHAQGGATGGCNRDEQAVVPPTAIATAQTADWGESWWMTRHQQKIEERRAMGQVDLLWIGDSITHGWERDGRGVWKKYYASRNSLNLGFDGDRTEQVLWRLANGAVDEITPKVAVLLIGTNNSGQRQDPPIQTAAGIEAILADLGKRLPTTKILLLAIFPRAPLVDGEFTQHIHQLNLDTNAIISNFGDGDRISFLNINETFLDKKGQQIKSDVMLDLLHLNEKGYKLWADAIEPTLARLLEEKRGWLVTIALLLGKKLRSLAAPVRNQFYVDRDYNAPIPRTYWIEVSARCNLKCPFCPTGNDLYLSEVSTMTFANYRQLFDKIKGYALYIYFHRHGEPTLNKDLLKIIRHTANHGGIYTLFSTNLNTLKYDSAKSEELVLSGISEVIASIDGASEESYAKYRRGGSYDFAITNLKELAEAKRRLGSPTPKLNWQFLINRFNEHEVDLARQVASDIGVDIYFLLMDVWGDNDWVSSYHRNPDKLATLQKGDSTAELKNAIGTLRERVPELPEYAVAHVDDVRIHDHFPWWCAQVFHTMAINTDGTVSPCTEIADSRFNLGNLFTDDIDDVWNSERFRRSRRYVMNKNVNGSICELCVRGENACSSP